ncbi:nuclear condensing complex subunit [Suillus subalutaceus]|uniref:nuclear condensing complex subunit n=1 Tax=Suillus subalutaceus TaxID=48586 RepID=UPI001B864DAD|nr:nuclear condensing complex subunit [Suillus subalutaceus]KAG1847661.1 nuclear condensing complex subunit [Suillus subalutaceus]
MGNTPSPAGDLTRSGIGVYLLSRRPSPPASPKIFDQVQNSTANHQKNIVALYKLHLDAANFTEPVHDGRSIKLTGERMFEEKFKDILCRAAAVKKGTSQGDRIVKFVGAYTKYINERATEVKKEDDDDDDDDETTASRFVEKVLAFLLIGFEAKDKVARYRCVHFLAEMVAHLGEISEKLYTELRTALFERVHDKETFVRVQAVIALSKLCGSEDPSDVEEGEPTALEVLLETLSCDPAADVRRAALLNIPLSSATLDAVLARTRDTDTIMRKLVYSAILVQHCFVSDGSAMGLVHPRVLTIAQREFIIRNGLGDREPAVRQAAALLLSKWVDVARGDVKNEESKTVEDDVLALLSLFDLTESTVAEDALLSVLDRRRDISDHVEFKDAYWANLTPERAFFARVFVDHCIAIKDAEKLDASLPVVTALAYHIQAAYNAYQEDLEVAEQERVIRSEPTEEEEEARIDKEFVIGEMLKVSVNLDYADEIGRRKMFQLVRDMISQEALPESLVARCLDVLRMLSPNERDLIRVVVEVVHELRDVSDEEESLKEPADDGETNFGETPMPTRMAPKEPKSSEDMSSEERARMDAIDLRCLSLCIGMLERVNGTFEENSTLEGILGELIIPAVKRKELVLREKGLICLGLCCLIARRMALNSFQLFLGQIQTAPEVLKIQGGASERIVEFFLHVLEHEESDKVQALLCIGLAKLVLAGMICDDKVLQSLVAAYLAPDTIDNQEVRQCLAYFFPVYCYSSPVNQRRMQRLFVGLFEKLAPETRNVDETQEMVSPAQIAAMFVDWTDPQKAIEVQDQPTDETIHIDLASDIARALFDDKMIKEDKKVLYQVLGRLYLPDKVDDDKIRTLKLLLHNLNSRRPIRDTAAKNALAKFDAAISKRYAEQLESFNEEDYRQLEYLKDLFEFLDDIIPLDDGEEVDIPRTRARKRRSGSIATDTTDSIAPDESVASATSSSHPKAKGRGKQTKRRRVSDSDDSDDIQSYDHVTPAPTRTLPKRAASVKKPQVVQLIEDDDDAEEQEEEEEEASPPPASQKGRRPRPATKARGDIQPASAGNSTLDSIMDSEEDEEEEEEVANDILGSE